ncbi:Hypothetical predicted protein [Octopus vulgaris]|uniref:Uncharacterized protein n=1 Tax=Octopus vulgaris TaxID=6645 RepID=A0AA36F3H1_OCTVU|nr:Hypothetical predicted protein [Octopus vulgaris]
MNFEKQQHCVPTIYIVERGVSGCCSGGRDLGVCSVDVGCSGDGSSNVGRCGVGCSVCGGYSVCGSCSVSDGCNDTVMKHLIKLRKRFSYYFRDLESLTDSWFVDPLKCEIADVPEEHQGLTETLLEHRSNHELRIVFKIKAKRCKGFQNWT